MAGFVGEDASLGGGAAAAFLAPSLFERLLSSGGAGFGSSFEFVEQLFPSQLAVLALVPGGLRADLDSGWQVDEHDASRSLVHVLPAVSARTNEGLTQVRLANAQLGHALDQAVIGIETGRLHRSERIPAREPSARLVAA